MRFNPADYEPVEDRLRRFWADHPEGHVTTSLVHVERLEGRPVQYVVQASVHAAEGRLLATGYAEEMVGSSNVNKTSALENCETSAIGRALANANYAPKGKRPSREEMAKADRAPATPSDDGLALVAAATTEDELRALWSHQELHAAILARRAELA